MKVYFIRNNIEMEAEVVTINQDKVYIKRKNKLIEINIEDVITFSNFY